MKILIILMAICLAMCGCGKKDDPEQLAEGRTAKNLEGYVELDLELHAITMATPSRNNLDDISLPHLRKYEEGRKYEPFMVIEGLKNLALYKPVMVSDEPLIGEIEQIDDGIKTSTDFDFVEGPKWVQVDLEEPVLIHAVVMWHYYKSPVIYDDIVVQISDDADFSQHVRTLFNNDHDNSAGMGKGNDTAYISVGWGEIVDARNENLTPATARYVRVYTGLSTDGMLPRYVEIAVYGKRITQHLGGN